MSESSDANVGWRRLPPGLRVVLVILAGLVALNALGWALDRAAGGEGPGGGSSSSYATAPEGLAAYASLLERFGVDVERQRGALTETSLDPSATLVVLDPTDLSRDDRDAIGAFVDAGGDLLTDGTFSHGLLDTVLADPPTWDDRGAEDWSGVPGAGAFAGLDEVRSSGDGSFRSPGSGSPVVDAASESLVVVHAADGGTVTALADASPLQNRLLAEADNAALGLALVGDAATVVFAEGVHGFGETTGVAAIPTDWKVALGGLVLAAGVAIWSRARRLGPPERAARDLAPPRAAYVDALARSLARTDRDGALAPLRHAARDRLRRRSGLPSDADDERIRAAARRLGWSEQAIEGVLGTAPSDDAVVAAGAALAEWERGTT